MGRFFRFFEDECHPLPFAIFRIAFFVGVAMHLIPSFMAFDANYGAEAFRIGPQWNRALYVWLPTMPRWFLVGLAGMTTGGI